MKSRIYLPKSMKELAGLGKEKLKELWLRYFDSLPRNADQKMVRMIWYKVQCENHSLRIEQKHITKLNKYSADPEGCIEKSFKARYHIRGGTEIVKTYGGKQYKVLVRSPQEYIYDGQCYPTISAVAKVICGKKVSGYDFFGLGNKHYGKCIVEKAEPAVKDNVEEDAR